MNVSLEYADRPRLFQARGGHYESWFVHANHAREPRALGTAPYRCLRMGQVF